MSGLCGWMAHQSRGHYRRAELEQMIKRIKHRGPYRTALFEASPFFLGGVFVDHGDVELRKLPTRSQDHRFVARLDGDIFNKTELVSVLNEEGSNIKRINAEEILIELYRHEGVSGFSRINGHFAFVLWDTETSTLVMGRDWFGTKPLFFRKEKDRLLFASEAKAILSVQSEPVTLDLSLLHLFMNFQFLPGPYSLFSKVEQLEPGTVMICTPTKVSVRPLGSVRPVLGASKKTALRLEEALSLSLMRQCENARGVLVPLDATPESQLLAQSVLRSCEHPRFAQFEGNYYAFGQDQINIELLEMTRGLFNKHTKKTFFSALDLNMFESIILNVECPMPGAMLPFLQYRSYPKTNYRVLSNTGFDHLFMTHQTIKQVYLRSLGFGAMREKYLRNWFVLSDKSRATVRESPYRDGIEHYGMLEGIWDISGKDMPLYGSVMRKQSDLPDCIELLRQLCNPQDAQSAATVLDQVRCYEKNIALRYRSAWIADRALSFCSIEGFFPFLDCGFTDNLTQVSTTDLPPKRSWKYLYKKHFKARLLARYMNAFGAYDPRIDGFNSVIFDWLEGAYKVYLNEAMINKHGLFDAKYLSACLAIKPGQRSRQTHQHLFMVAGIHVLLEHWCC